MRGMLSTVRLWDLDTMTTVDVDSICSLIFYSCFLMAQPFAVTNV